MSLAASEESVVGESTAGGASLVLPGGDFSPALHSSAAGSAASATFDPFVESFSRDTDGAVEVTLVLSGLDLSSV